VDAELATLRRAGWAAGVLAARRVCEMAAANGVLLGAPDGVLAEGQVPTLLGQCPPTPWPTPPSWLRSGLADSAWIPGLTVAAGRRADLVAELAMGTPALLPVAAPAAPPAGTIAAEGPVADGEMLAVLAAPDALPLLPGAAGDPPVLAWTAADCVALGLPVLALCGDPALDVLDRAQRLIGDPAPLPTDDLRLLLAAGDVAGLPLPTIGDDTVEFPPDVLAAFCAALLPADPGDAVGWAALGAMLYGPQGPHPWLRNFIRRRVGQVPVSYHYPAFAPVLDPTAGLPLFCEQVTLLQLLISTDAVPVAGRMALEEWLGGAARQAQNYSAAWAAGDRLHRALRLKATDPAAFLAAVIESTLRTGTPGGLEPVVLEARRRGIALLPPDVDRSEAGLTLEAGTAPPAPEGTRRPAAPPPPAIRWGLGWSRGMRAWAAARTEARAVLPEGRFSDFNELCTVAGAAGVPVAYLGALIRAGACDRFGSRAALLAALPAAMEMAAIPDVEGESASALAAATDSPAQWRAWEQHLLGYAFTPPEGTEPILRAGGPRGVARLTLGGIGSIPIGGKLTLPVVLRAVREVHQPGGGDPLAVGLAQDVDGVVPLVLFPPEYARFRDLLVADTAVILAARVQRAEGESGGGAGVILIAERLQPYAALQDAPELNLSVRKTRPPAERPAAAPKPAADPYAYSATGQPYLRAPRPAPEGVEQPAPPPTRDSAPPPAAESVGAPGQIVITLHALADEAADETRMRELKAIILRHPGPTGVMLYFPDDPLVGMPTTQPLKRTVSGDESFCAEIEGLLGAGCYERRQ
jgi:hypothetical protein